MRIYNKLIISLAIAFSVINVVLASIGQNDIKIYFIADAMAYFIITFLFVNLSPRARASLIPADTIIFCGFLAIVSFKVIEILK